MLSSYKGKYTMKKEKIRTMGKKSSGHTYIHAFSLDSLLTNKMFPNLLR